MKKLSKKAQTKIVGGAGLSGALFSGIGTVINSIGNVFATIVGSIVNAVHSFTDPMHLKAEYKFGSAVMSYDDSKLVDLDKEALKHENDLHLVKAKPLLTHQTLFNETYENDFEQKVEVLNENLDLQNLEANSETLSSDFLHEFF